MKLTLKQNLEVCVPPPVLEVLLVAMLHTSTKCHTI